MIVLYHRTFSHSPFTVQKECRKQYRKIEEELTAQVKKDYPGLNIELFSKHCFTDVGETIVCLVFKIEVPDDAGE